MKIGFHIPFSGNLKRLTGRVSDSRGNVFQFFSRTLRGGRLPEIKDKQLINYYDFLLKRGIASVIMHAPYSYNLAVENSEAVKLMIEDLNYAKKVQSRYYVINPGYSKKLVESEAYHNVKRQITYALENTDWQGIILIRNMAGGGTELGADLYRWNELLTFHPRVKGALDFARAFSFGYNFFSDEDSFVLYNFIEREIGWDNIPLIYINDSNRFCGSKRDDSVPLGDGVIGFHGYNHILKEEKVLDKIWIIENQPDVTYYDKSINYLVEFHRKRGRNNV